MLRAVVRVDPRAVTHKCVGARPSKLALPAVAPFGARILARGNAAVALEHGVKERTVIS
jgi:hypothetical protein